MKKIAGGILLIAFMFTLTGCMDGLMGFFNNISNMITPTEEVILASENTDVVQTTYSAFVDAIDVRTEDDETLPSQMMTDLYSFGWIYLADSIYRSIAIAYDEGTGYDDINDLMNTSLTVSKANNIYNISYSKDSNNYVITIEVNSTLSMRMSATRNGTLEYVSDRLVLADGYVATQTYMYSESGSKIYMLYTNGVIGKFAIDNDVSEIPTSIYNTTFDVANFANTGDKYYVVTETTISVNGTVYTV